MMSVSHTRHTLLLSIVLVGICFSDAQSHDSKDSEPLVLAESDFLWDDDNWTVSGNATDFQHGNRMVKAADEGPDLWYFVAPGKFLGAKRAAYRGQLSFRHGFFEYNSEGYDVQNGPFDVVLISEPYELVIGYPKLFPPWEFRSDHVLNLDETAGWISNSTGGPPSRPDMVRVLTKLSAIWIRGGIYRGHEDCYIGNVKLTAGPADSQPKKSSLKSQKILSAESPPAYDSEEIPPPPEASQEEENEVPPPPQDEDLPPLDSDADTPPADPKSAGKNSKKKAGMFGGLFGGKGKGGDDEL